MRTNVDVRTRSLPMKSCFIRRFGVGFVLYTYVVQLAVGCVPVSTARNGTSSRREALGPPASYSLIPTDTVSPGLTVGETPFTYSVGIDGQAQVTIPIWSSPGRGGLQPQLALTYSSRAGQGVFGQGWSLAG